MKIFYRGAVLVLNENYDSADGRIEEDDDHIGESDDGSTSDASDEYLDCATEDTSDGSDNSDYDSAFSKEDPVSSNPKERDGPGSSATQALPRAVAVAAVASKTAPISNGSSPGPRPVQAALSPTANNQAIEQRRHRSTPRVRHKKANYRRQKTSDNTPTL